MARAANEPVLREWTRPRKWLAAVEIVHYLWDGFGLFIFAMLVFPVVLQMAERFSNWGTVSKWEVNYAAYVLLGLSYSAATIYSGRCMERRRRRRLSVALALAHVPTGIGLRLGAVHLDRPHPRVGEGGLSRRGAAVCAAAVSAPAAEEGDSASPGGAAARCEGTLAAEDGIVVDEGRRL